MKWRRRTSSGAKFSKGEQVEITSNEPGFEGSWFEGKVIRESRKRDDYFLVQYKSLLDESESNPLREYVDYTNLRPPQPKGTSRFFKVGEEVDAFHNDGWWFGVIRKVEDDSRYTVYFGSSKEEMEFHQSVLRLHLEWIDGSWVQVSQKQGTAVVDHNEGRDHLVRHTAVAVEIEGSDLSANPTRTRILSILANQQTSAAAQEDFCEHILSSSPNMSQRMDSEATAKTTDLPFNVFLSQNNLKHTTRQRDGEILKTFKKRGREATKAHMSLIQCYAREMVIQSPTDMDSQCLRSFRTTKGKRTKFPNRRAKNPVFAVKSLSSSIQRSNTDNHTSKQSTESSSQLRSDVTETENFLDGLVKPLAQFHKEQPIVLLTQQIHEPVSCTDIGPGGVEGVNNLTETVMKRKRGRPKGSVTKSSIRKARGRALALKNCTIQKVNSQASGPENESTTKGMTNIQTECAQLPSSIVEEQQTYFTFPEETDSPVVKENGSNLESLETSNKDLKVVQIDCTQLLSHAVEEHHTFASCLPKCDHPIREGIEDEAASNDLTIDEIDCTKLLSSGVEEAPTLSSGVGTSNTIVDENRDSQLMSDVTIALRNTPTDSFKHPLPTNEDESSFSLEAGGKERALQCSFDLTTNASSSPVQEDKEHPPLEKENLPFIKSSHMWANIESMEVFQLMPQHPHFRPLEKVNEEIREGIAIGHMLNFTNLIERTCKAHLDDPRSMFENKLKALTGLEELGFTVQPMRSRLEEMLKTKDTFSELDCRSRTAEKDLIDEKCQFVEIQESIDRLNMQLQSLLTMKEMKGFKVAELERTTDEFKESIKGARLYFDDIIAAPWK